MNTSKILILLLAISLVAALITKHSGDTTAEPQREAASQLP